ncbi:oleate hydratase [Corynebacterium kroppenstedtii]|nr:oleate hydratase [Corynebacterium kroppenstedtii]
MGEEVLREFYYHFEVDEVEKTIKHTKVRLAVMPYITFKFVPRDAGDRHDPVPARSTNLGFTG